VTDPVLIRVEGPAKGKGRPRFVRATGRTYTDPETLGAEERIRAAWRAAGSPDYGTVPVRLNVRVLVSRPQAHRRVNGLLTQAGIREPYPSRLPDLDNVLKTVADALNKCAYRDDRQIVDSYLSRRWATLSEHDHVLIWIAPLTTAETAELVAA
jgi:Holliday junction resolvase RusA-like endonuclease